MPTIANSNAETKAEIRDLSIGSNGRTIITVGNQGRFATVSDALDWIATQAGPQLITTTNTIELTQWSHFAPLTVQANGGIENVQVGDFLYIDNDDPAEDAFQHDYHYYRILSSVSSDAESKAGFLLESGILGASQASKAIVVYRFPRYEIKMGVGTFDTSGTFPDGYDIMLSGHGRQTIAGGAIAMPIYGNFEITNFIQKGGLTTFDTRTVDPTDSQGNGTLLDACFATFSQHDMWLESEGTTVAGNSSFQSMRSKNLECNGFKGHRIYNMMMADFCQVENIRYDCVSSMETVEVFVHARRQSTSWVKEVRNCKFRRSQDLETHTANSRGNFIFGLDPVNSAFPRFRMDFFDTIIEDDDLKTQTHNNALLEWQTFDQAIAKATVRFFNCQLNNYNSHTYDMSNEAAMVLGTTLKIEFHNTYNYDRNTGQRKLITHDFGVLNAPVVIDFDKDAFKTFPFNSFLLPEFSVSQTIIYGTMTSAVTFLNPATNCQIGQICRLVFTQDATGGRAIIWSGVLWKVNSNPVGAANQKAVFEFYYDGSNYIQIGTTGWG